MTRERLGLVALVLLVAAPLVFLPWGMNRWVFPKELVAVVGVLLASLVASAGRLPRWLWILAAATAVTLVAGALFGAAPLAQLLGRWPRYEGLVTLPVYLAVGWAGARLLGPAAAATRALTFVRALSGAAVLLGIVSTLEAVGLRPISSNLERPGALLGNASDQGIVAVLLVALLWLPGIRSLSDARTRVDRWLPLVGLAFAAASAVLSASRAAIIALVVVILAAGVYAIVTSASRRTPAFVGFGMLALTLLTVALIPLSRSRVLGVSELAGDTVSDRLAGWSETLALVLAHPLGVGPSGFVDRIPLFHSDTWFAEVGSNITIDSPHNWLLQALAAGGFPLLALAAAVTVLVGVAAARTIRASEPRRRDLLVGSTIALVAWAGMLLTHFTSPGNTLLPALLLGATVATPPSVARRALARVRTAAIAVWVIVLGVATAAEVPLQAGLEASADGRVGDASAAFDTARTLRFWDADLTSIAAQSFAGAADAGVPDAAGAGIAWANRSLAIVPDSVETLKALAVAQQYEGRFDEAIATLDRAAELSPNDPGILHRLGGIQALDGALDEAKASLERAVTLDPAAVGAWQTLKYVYEQLGDAAGAARAQTRITDLGR